jgi:hypothetical protein
VLSPALPPGVSLPSVTTPTTEEDDYLDTMSTSSIDDLFDDEFRFNDGFGINAIRTERFDILTDTSVVTDDPTNFDVMPSIHCQCCPSEGPLDQYLHQLDTQSDLESADAADCHLRNLLSDDPVSTAPLLHKDFSGPCAHLDDGAQASTTHDATHLHHYQLFTTVKPCRIRLVSADGNRYTPLGYGILRIPAPTHQGYIPILCYHCPEIRSIIVSPRSFEKQFPTAQLAGTSLHKFPLAGVFSFLVHHKLRKSEDLTLHGTLHHGLCYTSPILLPHALPDAEPAPADTADIHVNALLAAIPTAPASPIQEFRLHKLYSRAERLLWHQRLGHPSDGYLYAAHKHIDGVPSFKRADPILDSCPTCIAAKLKKSSPGHHSTRKATIPWQGISVDFAFTGQRSKNKTRATSYRGLNGETCYILLADHATSTLAGTPRISKGAPLNWLDNWLKQHAPNIPGQYVYLDQGGELYNNQKVRALFQRHGYAIRPTGADSSHQNGPVERAHQTIGNALRTMLIGANLDARFWPYAFHAYLRIKNALPFKDQSSSPDLLRTNVKPDFTALRTFGCRVWVRPPGLRSGKLLLHARKGIFLGFLPSTTKNLLWYDDETKRVKIAFHARFDEGMNDLATADLPPNVLHLQRVQNDTPLPPESDEISAPPFGFTLKPFANEHDLKLTVCCTDPTFGFRLATDTATNRAYISDILPATTAATLCSSTRVSRRKYTGAFVTAIDDAPVHTAADASRALRKLASLSPRPAHVSFTLAPEPLPSSRDRESALKELDIFSALDSADDSDELLTLDALRAIHRLHTSDPVDCDDLTSSEIDLMISAIQSDAVTDAERALNSFTRRRLKTLDTWPLWHKNEVKQLDQFHELGMYGPPCYPPKDAILLSSHWQYRIKLCGKRRSRNCCDGSPRAAPKLHALAETYASCVEQPIFRMFCALSAALNLQIFGGDAQDAFAHSPAPKIPTFIRIDDAYHEWYKAKFNVNLDRKQVLPVLHALQGHPEAARLWEEHITRILADLGFTATTHERNIYSATIRDQQVLLLRQVDDFALATSDPSIATYLYEAIGKALQLPGEPTPPFEIQGHIKSFNGVDVHQTRDYIKINSENYIRRLLVAHHWETPTAQESIPGSRPSEPLKPSDIHALYNTVGPAESTPEHAKLESDMGFSYRSLLGELLFAYVTTRPDIGYAVTTLAKFAIKPSTLHYHRLKDVAKYLRNTIDWGIIYWRSAPNAAFPAVPLEVLLPDPALPTFPSVASHLQLVGYVDAAHGNDLRQRRSTTGYCFMLSGGAIAYRSKTQTITATSSTEAEFIAAVSSAKVAKYLRSILAQLGFAQVGPTQLHEDNESTIKMVNADKPTERSRHIDIQYFAIQDWRKAGHIFLTHLRGILNPSDALTKSVGWVLHSRHARRLMGHFGFAPAAAAAA